MEKKRDKKNKEKKGLFRRKKKENPPATIASPLNNQMLNYQVYAATWKERLGVGVISFLLGGLSGWVFYGDLFMVDGYRTVNTLISNAVVFIVLGLVACKFAVPVYVKHRKNKRDQELRLQFRSLLDSLATSVSAGSNHTNAFYDAYRDLKHQYSDDAYIVRELKEVVDGVEQGIPMLTMLRSFADRCDNDDIQSFVDIYGVCHMHGSGFGMVVRRIHSVISDKMEINDEIETKLTSNKMQHYAMSAAPIVIVGFLRWMNDYFAESFATMTGVMANTVAIVLFIAAFLYGLKIIDIKE